MQDDLEGLQDLKIQRGNGGRLRHLGNADDFLSVFKSWGHVQCSLDGRSKSFAGVDICFAPSKSKVPLQD